MDIPYSSEDIFNILNSGSEDYQDSIFLLNDIRQVNYNLDAIFKDRYSVIIFIENPNETVGHFTLLTHLSDKKLEYFDSFASPPPDDIKKLAEINKMALYSNSKKLQSEKSNVCAKYCLLRMQSLPVKLSRFIKIFDNDSLTPDELVMTLIKTKYKKKE